MKIHVNNNTDTNVHYNPYFSSKPNQTSLVVGNDGTACQSQSSGTSPTIAIVAECNKSPTCGPIMVAPTIT